MFSYLKNVWYEEEAQTPTIESLLKLCKAGEVKRVIIPSTYYGYGSTLIDDSNRRSIKRHYRKSRFIDMHYSLTMSASQFVRNEHYREFIEQLAEQYPLFDEQDYSELENETKLEFLVDEISFMLDNEDAPEYPAGITASWTKERVREILESGGWSESEWTNTRIEWWEHVIIDMDGYTPYAEKKDVEMLAALVKARAVKREN